MLKKSIAYAHIRAEWKLADYETRIEMDTPRSIAHNAFIDACNILSRNMHLTGEDATWRKKLGENRKEIGDFACYLHAILGIKAR